VLISRSARRIARGSARGMEGEYMGGLGIEGGCGAIGWLKV
jgi:hypothetical protein